MSQISKDLKRIAASDEYKALEQAIDASDYDAICKSYLKVSELLEGAKKQVLDKIQGLSRQNKLEESQKFLAAFAIRAGSTMPKWQWLVTHLREQGVKEGEVFGIGSKGDPMVRTVDGRVTVLSGAKLEKGTKVGFMVLSKTERLDFGRVFEFKPEVFYFLMNLETRNRLKGLFDSVDERTRSCIDYSTDEGLSKLGAILVDLETARELGLKLQDPEKGRMLQRIQAYRKRLLLDCCESLAFRLISDQEDREIAECCGEDTQKGTAALPISGLFSQEVHERLKAELFSGEEPTGYADTLHELEAKVDSMDAALKLMEFQSSVDKALEPAKRYVEKMDILFERLHRRSRQLALSIAEDRVCSADEIVRTIEEAFSPKGIRSEFTRVFRGWQDFSTLRGAALQLKAMGGSSSGAVPLSASKPQTSNKLVVALGQDN